MRDIIQSLIADGGFLRVRATIALGITGVVAYLFVTGRSVPDELMQAWFTATAFYFGTRAAQGKNGPPPPATPLPQSP